MFRVSCAQFERNVPSRMATQTGIQLSWERCLSTSLLNSTFTDERASNSPKASFCPELQSIYQALFKGIEMSDVSPSLEKSDKGYFYSKLRSVF